MLPPRRHLPRARLRGPGRPGHHDRHPPARRRHRARCHRAWPASTSCSATPWRTTRSPGRAPGNTYWPPRCCCWEHLRDSRPARSPRSGASFPGPLPAGDTRGRPRHRVRRPLRQRGARHDRRSRADTPADQREHHDRVRRRAHRPHPGAGRRGPPQRRASRRWSTGSSAAARPSSRTSPGVTRDRVSYDANWNGRAFTVVDTGGWDPDAQGLAERIAPRPRSR